MIAPTRRSLVPLSLALVLGLTASARGGDGLTKGNFDKIKEGQSLAAAEKIMGGKGTTLTRAELRQLLSTDKGLPKEEMPEAVQAVRWGDAKRFIAVVTVDNRVVAKHASNLDAPPAGLNLGRLGPRRSARPAQPADPGQGPQRRRRGEGGQDLLPEPAARLSGRRRRQPAPPPATAHRQQA